MSNAVIFDLDGTLTDTEQVWDEVRRGLAVEDGVPWPEEATTAMMGMSTTEWATYLATVVGYRGTPSEIADRVIAGLQQRYAENLPVIPGAVEAVHRMAACWPTAIASSSPLRVIAAAVAALGIEESLQTYVSTEEVPRGKPHPDGFLEAARRLGIPAANCVVVEDSTSGILAGLAAGMKVIAIPPHFHPPAPETLANCHLVLDDLNQLTPEAVRALFA